MYMCGRFVPLDMLVEIASQVERMGDLVRFGATCKTANVACEYHLQRTVTQDGYFHRDKREAVFEDLYAMCLYEDRCPDDKVILTFNFSFNYDEVCVPGLPPQYMALEVRRKGNVVTVLGYGQREVEVDNCVCTEHLSGENVLLSLVAYADAQRLDVTTDNLIHVARDNGDTVGKVIGHMVGVLPHVEAIIDHTETRGKTWWCLVSREVTPNSYGAEKLVGDIAGSDLLRKMASGKLNMEKPYPPCIPGSMLAKILSYFRKESGENERETLSDAVIHYT
jgi:hypothetical protein